MDQTSVSHLFPITKYLGLLATGMTGMLPKSFATLVLSFILRMLSLGLSMGNGWYSKIIDMSYLEMVE